MKQDFVLESAVIKNFKDLDESYTSFMILMTMGNLFAVPLFGWFADSIDLRIPIPISFLARAIVCYSFTAVEDPRSTLAYTLAFLLTVTTAV